VIELFLAEGFRADHVNAVALGRAHESQRGAGRAAGVFNQRVPGRHAAVFFGGGDQAQGHAVLHAARRILKLELSQDPGAVPGNDAL